MARSSRPDETRFMRRALALAERGRGRTRPNPVVGAVVVRAGRVVGSGWHERAGAEHAEVVALREAGPRARGATLYCTLEPCAHHGRTPPCTDAIVRAGIRRCVVAQRDPHAIVNGRGLRRLRDAGVEVEVGLLEDEAREALRGYRRAHREGLPRVTWKVGMTLDGRIADRSGQARWITGPEARRAGHRMRARADAVVIGAGTARQDDPRLTVRLGDARSPDARGAAGTRGTPGTRGTRVAQPLRVVCDTRLRLPLALRLFGRALAAGTVVACGPDAPVARARALERRGVRVWRLPLSAGRVSPRALARRLAAAGCFEVLLESGPMLGTAWLEAGLVERLALFTAPVLLGSTGLAWCGPLAQDSLGRARRGRVSACGMAGTDSFMMVEISPGR
jgi:diaminohydroxyphosphoribosylaminopyrimidine deaminase / 5-amino-6-(5-phosphoribosylamino)uracil reductase